MAWQVTLNPNNYHKNMHVKQVITFRWTCYVLKDTDDVRSIRYMLVFIMAHTAACNRFSLPIIIRLFNCGVRSLVFFFPLAM
jgi:hypothetical protein